MNNIIALATVLYLIYFGVAWYGASSKCDGLLAVGWPPEIFVCVHRPDRSES